MTGEEVRRRVIFWTFDVVGQHYAERSSRPPIVSFERDTAYTNAIRAITGYPSIVGYALCIDDGRPPRVNSGRYRR